MTGMAAGIIFRTRTAVAAAPSKINWKVAARATVFEALVLALSIFSFQLLSTCGLFRYLATFGTTGPALVYWSSFSGGMFFHAAAIYVFARSAGWVSQLFGSRAMVFLGEISFAFYMIHYQLILFVKQEFWIGSNFSIGYFAVLTLAMSVGVSACLYYLVEVPAKETLLRWYAGKSSPHQSLVTTFTNSVRHWTQSSMIYSLIIMLLVPVVITKLYKRADRKSFTAQKVLESVSPEFRPFPLADTLNF